MTVKYLTHTVVQVKKGGNNPHTNLGSDAYVAVDAKSFADRHRPYPHPLGGTDLQITRTLSNCSSFSSAHWWGGIQWVYTGFPGYQNKGDSFPGTPARVQMARSRFGQGKFDAGEFLPDFDKTVKLIANRLNRINKLAYNATTGNIRGIESETGKLSRSQRNTFQNGMRGAKLTSDAWLELHFGWGNLQSDIYGAMQQFTAGFKKQGDAAWSHSGTKSSDIIDVNHIDTSNYTTGMPNLGPLASAASTHGTVDNPVFAALNSIGLANPALLVWEHLPLSFMVDWALPISDWLRAFTASIGFKNVFTSTVWETRRDNFLKIGPWVSTTQNIYRGTDSSLFGMTPWRISGGQIPSLNNVADALAIAGQRFR